MDCGAASPRFMGWLAWVMVGVVLFTLTFDSSPIKGEGIRLVLACCPRPVDSRLRGNDGLKDYDDLQDWDVTHMDGYGLGGFNMDDGYVLLEWWFSESGFTGLKRCPGIIEE